MEGEQEEGEGLAKSGKRPTLLSSSYDNFLSMKQLGLLLLPQDGMLVHCKKKEIIIMVILMYSVMLECNLVLTFFHVLLFFSRYRRKHTWTESFTSWIWNPSYDNLTEGTFSCTVLVLVFYLHYNVSQQDTPYF